MAEIWARVLEIRAAARFVFDEHPELARLPSSERGRQQRATHGHAAAGHAPRRSCRRMVPDPMTSLGADAHATLPHPHRGRTLTRARRFGGGSSRYVQ